MKCIGITLYFLILFDLTNALHAQLSPGDLARAHEHLEGNTNCTLCHTLGEKVSNEKCLECHKEVKARIDMKKGYHVSDDVRGKSCASCHNDHHGKNFQIVKFEEKTFDHNKTGYSLTGKHARIDCKDCHKSTQITDPKIQIKKYTFLGLEQQCKSCHKDYHQNTLSSNCASCHNTESFAPAVNFKHEKTGFPLSGKHRTTACNECHKIELRNGEKFQLFADIAFSNCSSCHEDVHKKNLGNRCNECHIEESFTSLSGLSRFNHSKTEFPLNGLHKKQQCSECHKLQSGPLNVFQDKKGISVNDCAKCHQDVHKGKFGTDCKECHSEEGFRNKINLQSFDHNLTSYKLEGKHQKVDCKSCHKQNYTEPIVYNICASCHTDYHKGEFSRQQPLRDCASCHTVYGFQETNYTIEDHSLTKFPLEGAHLATPCNACHKKTNEWKFSNIGNRCVDCHTDVHKGYIVEKYYPDQNCTYCHSTESWTSILFDHALTGYSLEGKHVGLDCMKCHGLKPNENGNKYSKFITLSGDCVLCHSNVHGSQFEVNGITNCSSCHDFTNWKPNRFNHDNTAFKLEGKHLEISCNACHKEVEVNDKIIIQYKLKNFECANCHQ